MINQQFILFYLVTSDGTVLILKFFSTILTHSVFTHQIYYIHTYHSRFIPEGVAEASQIPVRLPRFTKII
jgi:hypothetical protein